MDKLDLKIADKERALAEARDAVSALEIELKTLRLAAILRPSGDIVDAPTPTRGKPPGSISDRWKSILAEMVRIGNQPISSPTIRKIALKQGLDISLAGVRMRLKDLRRSNYIKYESEKGYSVTSEAIDKFGFS